MPIVSISEASRLVNKCRQTIYKHIRQGKLSTLTCVDGLKSLDISELIRVYGVSECHFLKLWNFSMEWLYRVLE